MQIKDNIEHTYDALKSFDSANIVDFINDYFNEEEKVNILRNIDFIHDIPQELLTLMLNNMSLISVFNMLQNKELFNKVDNININLTSKDSLFIPDVLNNIEIVNKINHNMLKNMLINIPKKDTINYLKEPYINIKLSIDSIVNISILKGIDLLNDYNIIEKLSKDQLIKYIDGYWKNKINYHIIDNKFVKKTLFNYADINLEEVIYLYEYLSTRSNQKLENVNKDLSAFKACVAIHEIFGLQESINVITRNKLGLNDVRTLFKEVDISRITDINNLKSFIILYLKDHLDNKDNNTIISFGNMINNFNSNFLSKSLDEIDNEIAKKYNINKNISNISYLINKPFNSNLEEISNNINLKIDLMKKTSDIYNIKGNNFETISNNDEANLLLNNDINHSNFVINNNGKYIECTIIDDKIKLIFDNDIDKKTIIEISKDLINIENINYIILETNRKDISGIKLSSSSDIDEIVIQKKLPIKTIDLLNDNKSKRR